jgi:hypothetical protein
MSGEGDSFVTQAGAPDAAVTTIIAKEIRALRKGRGLRASGLEARLGLNLRDLACAGETRDISELRRELSGALGSHAAQLPDDLRTAALASLGLSADTRQMSRFGDRVSWLAECSGCNYRTALRRIAVAEQLLAEEIARELARRAGQRRPATGGWYLDELRTVLRLDTPAPEAHEHRRIVAIRPGLTEVIAWLDVPRDATQSALRLEADIVHGGRLIRREEPLGSRIEFYVRLPTPLEPGETHEYELVLRVAQGQMRPHYIFTPECQCNTFDLTVRFDPDRPPAWVRRVDGETVRMFDHGGPGADLVALDGAGEVRTRFSNPARYLGYGLQWHP